MNNLERRNFSKKYKKNKNSPKIHKFNKKILIIQNSNKVWKAKIAVL